MIRRTLVYVLFVFALGCSEKESSTNDSQAKDNVFQTQIDAVDKAKSIEQQVLDASAKQRQAIKDEGG